ncbi:MAG: glycosyltransferase [Candidatus Omnitrophica bacterium]|nr:glycosyltransferase [Candidatus Omnitrophota bacterium]
MKVLLVIPTYNEAGNIERLLREIFAQAVDFDVVVIDDNSPDGTGAILDRLGAELPLRVVHREGKLGIGSAHERGFDYAREHGYTHVLTMDADFAHDPSYLRGVLACAGQADVVIGSRYIEGGGMREWSRLRRLITHTAHWCTTHLLGLPYDCTGGFRLYDVAVFERFDYQKIRSDGYAFLIEMLYHLRRLGCSIQEVPITIAARNIGTSKISRVEIFNAVKTLLRLSLHRLRQGRWLPSEAQSAADMDPPTYRGLPQAAGFPQRERMGSREARPCGPPTGGGMDWDRYWANAQRRRPGLYDLIAEFYRRYIISPAAAAALARHLPDGADRHYLHAGCGSGGSDQRLRLREAQVYALDLSPLALQLNRTRRMPFSTRHVCGDIFRLPYASGTMDGIFNFGVMEHFDGPDIEKILAEFHRVLKPGGRLMLFWPPEFGLSVIGLKVVTRLANVFRATPLKLHPDELSRIQSFAWIRTLMARNRFRVLETRFGWRDIFTYVVVVGEPVGAAEALASGSQAAAPQEVVA